MALKGNPMDKKDIKLLEILQRQGRIAISELADKVNMSDTPCLRRVKKLEQDKVIVGYSANVDPQKVGLSSIMYAFIRLNDHSDQTETDFEQAVFALPQVMECNSVTGEYDYMLKILAKDLNSYQRFIKVSLGSIPSIADIHSNAVLKQHFNRTILPIEV